MRNMSGKKKANWFNSGMPTASGVIYAYVSKLILQYLLVDNLAKKLLIIIWCCWDSETMNPGKLYWNISTLYVRGYIDRGMISVQNLSEITISE